MDLFTPTNFLIIFNSLYVYTWIYFLLKRLTKSGNSKELLHNLFGIESDDGRMTYFQFKFWEMKFGGTFVIGFVVAAGVAIGFYQLDYQMLLYAFCAQSVALILFKKLAR